MRDLVSKVMLVRVIRDCTCSYLAYNPGYYVMILEVGYGILQGPYGVGKGFKASA